MASLSFRHIEKIYPNNIQAVFDFNLEVKDNEFIVFVGPSGCGKSTTLRMVAGLEAISDGELYIDNKLINGVEPCDRDIAMVFQTYALYPHMTVFDNMAFSLKMRKMWLPLYRFDRENAKKELLEFKKQFDIKTNNKIVEMHSNSANKNDIKKYKNERKFILKKELVSIRNKYLIREKSFDLQKLLHLQKELNDLKENHASKEEIDKCKEKIRAVKDDKNYDGFELRHFTKDELFVKVIRAADILGLTDYLDRKPAALSGGQRQRVALGRAIVRNPKVFLMDEPLSNLDAKLRVSMRREIANIHRKVNATTIYVTHDQVEAMTMADRIVIMNNGRIQQVGTPQEVYDKPTNMFVAKFIGTPAMNFLNATVNGSKIKCGEVVIDVTKNVCSKALRNYDSKEIVMGIRPESIVLKKSKPLLEIEVQDIENLGNENLVYATIDNQSVSFKCSNKENDLKIGDKVGIDFIIEDTHFFDKDTTNRIS